MAERKAMISEVPSLEAVATMEPPATYGLAAQTHAWTLDEAFSIVRQALAAHYNQAENIPAYLACMEKQMLKDNGNTVVAWQHLIVLLEQALGIPLRMG